MDWTFGWTMLVVGMGGTIVTLMLFSLIMELLKKVFPYRPEQEKQD